MTDATLTLPRPAAGPSRQALIVAGAVAVTGLLAAAFARRLLAAGMEGLAIRNLWLAIHLVTVIPAVPLGAAVLARRKGDARHRLLGRAWAALMMAAALSSFGIRASGHLGWIHLLSMVVMAAVPRAILAARRGRIAAHVRGMTLTYAGLIAAGLAVFVPGRLLGSWLFG